MERGSAPRRRGTGDRRPTVSPGRPHRQKRNRVRLSPCGHPGCGCGVRSRSRARQRLDLSRAHLAASSAARPGVRDRGSEPFGWRARGTRSWTSAARPGGAACGRWFSFRRRRARHLVAPRGRHRGRSADVLRHGGEHEHSTNGARRCAECLRFTRFSGDPLGRTPQREQGSADAARRVRACAGHAAGRNVDDDLQRGRSA